MDRSYWPLQCNLLKIDATSLNHTLSLLLVIFVVATFGLSSCSTKQMSIEDAMKTTLSIRGPSYIPPPRSIDDIIGIIAQKDHKEGLVSIEWHNQLESKLQPNANKKDLIEHHIIRARAASSLGYYEQSKKDLLKAYELSNPEKVDGRILNLLSGCELNLLNYEKAIELCNIIKERQIGGLSPYRNLVFIYALSGQFEKADNIKNEAIINFRNKKLNPYDEISKMWIEYMVLNMRAKYEEAEPIMRRSISAQSSLKPARPNMVLIERIRLIRNLIEQNRLIDAELEARISIEETVKFLGTKSLHLMAAKTILAEVLLAQGRLADAEKVNQAAFLGYEQLNISSEFGWRARTVETMCKILVVKGDFSAALKGYEFFRAMKDSNRYIYEAFYRNDKNAMLALIMAGQYTEAFELIQNAYQKGQAMLGKNHPHCAELLALRGMVNNSLNNLDGAYRDFADSIPNIVKSKNHIENQVSRHRFMLIVESYLSLLSRLSGSTLEDKYSFSAPTKAFEISTLLSDSVVQNAVLASSGRMTIKDVRLKKLARTEQDVQQQVKAYQNLIQNMLSRPNDDIDRQAIKNLQEMIEKLSSAQDTIRDEIEKNYPDYANLINYRQVSFNQLNEKLRPDEVIVSICSAKNYTYIFTVPKTGSPGMSVVKITKGEIEKLVATLKNSLSSDSGNLGKLPLYDFENAYKLYSLLLQPTEAMWKNSKHMILSISGPLGQIPFSVITTEPFQLQNEEEVLFASYRQAPWLIKKITINTVPSISSFVALRDRLKSEEAKDLFVGFGHALFNADQLAQEIKEKKLSDTSKEDQNYNMEIRGIRLTKEGSLDNKKLISCTVESLERLPDTADELIGIAEALGANPAKDVYLGRQASEKHVKSINLSDRQVVAFASHALVPYDLDGLDQPAIALSSPSVTGDEDDGLLTMAEILDLKLNANWVVLSACNTGAADGAGSEAVSGLGRAFFYAGTKAVLVSMWPVETSSAKKITISIFRNLKESPHLTKAQAHRTAMLELMDGPGITDKEGRIIASYAHPFFWAPFLVVGDN